MKLELDIKKMHHISNLENKRNILENGLNANEEGLIYVFTDRFTNGKKVHIEDNNCGLSYSTADKIAGHQLGLKEYCLFEIDIEKLEAICQNSNIEFAILKDNVDEIPSILGHQFKIKIRNIPISCLSFQGLKNTDIDSLNMVGA